jgi:hypothetical protein
VSGVFPDPRSISPVGQVDAEEAQRARRTCARIAAALGATADDLREVLAALALIDGGPSGGRYTSDGRRVRPHRLAKRKPTAATTPEGEDAP